jgi:hypothetical protein
VINIPDPMSSSNSFKRSIDLVEQDGLLEDRGRVPMRHYQSITAQDHARQHNGDQYFYGPVSFQNNATRSNTVGSVQEMELTSVLKSLVFEQMDSRFMDVRQNLMGTCEWLLHTPEYKKWQDPSLLTEHHGFLWIKGKAGTGKSTLMKYVADIADARPVGAEHNLIFFFNARGASTEASSNGLFRTMLHQLLEKVPRLFNLLDKRRLKIAERQRWSSTLLRDVFRDAILHLEQDRVTCYIDAMDECRHEEVEDIVQFLDDLGDFAVGQTKQFYICLSSRHYPNLKISKSVELVLQHQKGHANDIQEYIRWRLSIEDEDLKRHLTEALEKKASGVFLWIVLVVALLNRDSRRGHSHEILKRLDHLPAELSDLFKELLERGDCSVYLPSLLRWISFSSESLRLIDLHTILLFGARSAGIPQMTYKDLNMVTRDTMAKFILESSKGLVEINVLGNAQYIHESVRTYFQTEGLKYLISDCKAAMSNAVEGDIQNFGMDHNEIMVARCYDQLKHCCLSYLMENVLESAKLSVPLPKAISLEMSMLSQQLGESHCFFTHAIKGVFLYAEAAQQHGLQQGEFLGSLPLNEIGILHQIKGPYDISSDMPLEDTPWDMARLLILNNCLELADIVLGTIHQPPAATLQWAKILATAIMWGHVEIVVMTMKHLTDPDGAFSTDRRRCLHEIFEGSKQHFFGQKVSDIGFEGRELLFEAIEEDDLAKIRSLLYTSP